MPRPQRGREFIFVVDDDPDLRPTLGEILEDAGYLPVLFESAEELLASLDQTMPAAIVTDIAMPGMSGAEMIARIRGNACWCRIPVAVITANNDTALPLRLDAPVLYKPDIGGIIPVIETLLSPPHPASRARDDSRPNLAEARAIRSSEQEPHV